MHEDVAIRRFGRYRLDRLISRGGMGEIYLAHVEGAAGFKKQVVIKKILSHLSQQPEFVTRFIDEANIVVSLTHGNIVPVFDMGEVEGEYFIAMEYIPGHDLGAVIQRYRQLDERMSMGLTTHIIAETCKALDYAHKKADEQGRPLHIIHRDVSPSNILLSCEGVVKLTDFGIAKAVSKLGRSITGQLQGKFSYMSPEQASGKSLDHRSDIFSLGTVAYELLTGVRPFEGDSDLDTLQRVRTAKVIPPSELVDELPDGLDDVILRALARVPADRFDQASEFGTALSRIGNPEGKVGSSHLAEELERLFPGGVGALSTPGSGMALDDILAMEADRMLLASPSGRSPTLTAAPKIQEPDKNIAVRPTPPELRSPLLTPEYISQITGISARKTDYWRTLSVILILAALAGVLLYVRPGYLLPSYLDIACNQPRAEVHVDGEYRGLCPVRLEVSPGRHEVLARTRDRTSPEATVELERGETRTVDLTLTAPEPTPVEIVVVTTPEGEFSFDGGLWYRSGTRVRRRPGPATVWARAEGHATSAVQLDFDSERTDVRIPLNPSVLEEPEPEPSQTEESESQGEPSTEESVASGQASRSVERVRLRVDVVPRQATIYDNGRPVGQGEYTTRYFRDDAPHIIRAQLEGYESRQETVVPERSRSHRIEWELVPVSDEVYEIRIWVPYPPVHDLFVNGVRQEQSAPTILQLRPGQYRVRVVNPETDQWDERIIHVPADGQTVEDLHVENFSTEQRD